MTDFLVERNGACHPVKLIGGKTHIQMLCQQCSGPCWTQWVSKSRMDKGYACHTCLGFPGHGKRLGFFKIGYGTRQPTMPRSQRQYNCG